MAKPKTVRKPLNPAKKRYTDRKPKIKVKTQSSNGPLSPRTKRRIVNGIQKDELQQLHTKATGTVAPSNVTKAELVEEINKTKLGAQIGAVFGATVGIIQALRDYSKDNAPTIRVTDDVEFTVFGGQEPSGQDELIKETGGIRLKDYKANWGSNLAFKAAIHSGIGAAAGATIGAIAQRGKK